MPLALPGRRRPRTSPQLLAALFITCVVAAALYMGLPQAGAKSAAASSQNVGVASMAGIISQSGLCYQPLPARSVPLDPMSADKPAPGMARGSRIPWQDGSYFLAGINYPQYQYYGGDIATLASVNANCQWFYSSSFDYAAIDADFADMQAHGVHVLRWWLFGDGRGAPEFDSNSMVTGFDATFFDHMDQAMEIAAHHNIYIIWSLWDFLAFEQANWLCGGSGLSYAYAAADKLPPELRDAYLAHLKEAEAAPPGWIPGTAHGDSPADDTGCMIYAGGHRNIVTDTSPGGAQDSFFNNALIPMLTRYANNPNIIGWEIMNEPEWTLNQNPYTGQNPTVQEPVDVSQMRAFFTRFTQAVHSYTHNQYATVGSASLKFMGFGQYLQPGLWSGLGFDYYGAHYYGWMDGSFNNGSPMSIDYNNTQQQLDAPVVIGELPANGGSAPVYLPSVRRSVTETSVLDLRYICTAYAPASEPPCTRPYTATIEYDNPNGAAALTQSVVVSPYGGWTGTVPSGASTFSGAARITSNGPVAAVVTQTGILSASEQTAYSGQDQANQFIWLPRVSNLGTHRSRIAVQNTSIHTAAVTINYYNNTGTLTNTANFTLAPHGSLLIDPLLAGSSSGPPSGFQGSAIVIGSHPLIVTAYELDPQLGSDAYNGEGQGYLHAVYLPSLQNSGNNGSPTIYLQNPSNEAAHDTISYHNLGGSLIATQTVTLTAYGSASVQPQSVLPGGFQGSAVITSDTSLAAVLRSVTTSGSVHTTEMYAGTQNPDQRFHFPNVHTPSGGSGQDTTITVQNVNPTIPITVWVTLSNNGGTAVYTNHVIVVPPNGQWVADVSSLPGVPAGFSGTAEVLWPYPNGWNQGFPLLATALDLDAAHTGGSIYRGIATHSQYWAVTPYTPSQLLEGIYANHWAGALSWSYYDQGTGTWDDYAAAISALNASHPADVQIGQSLYTPVPTPANSATATAAAATNTPAYGNGATATAVARLTGTPEPPCTTCSVTFSDVPPGSTFYTYIRCLACRGIISGYPDGTFHPNNNVTRGQISKILSNAAGFNDSPGPQAYQDVPTGSTFYTFVQRLSSHGAIGGYPCGGPGEPCVAPGNKPYFRPNNNATRGQISKIAVNTAITVLSWTLLNPTQSTFQDVQPGSTFYRYVETAYSHTLLSGYPCGGVGEPCISPANKPYFEPNRNASRGQTSKIVSNAFFQGCTP